MEKAAIVDVTGLNKDGLLVAHMPKVACNYYRVLSMKYTTVIAGGPAYEKQFTNCKIFKLPFDTLHASRRRIISRIVVKIHEVINTMYILNSDNDILIFQSYSRLSPILIGLLIGKSKGKKIFLIQYFTSPRISFASRIFEDLLIQLNKNRIAGIICTSEKVAERFDAPHVIVPDYFYFDDEYTNDKSANFNFDFGIFGQISIGKRVEDVINAFSGRSETVIIAGRFSSEDRFEKCKLLASDNIIIINRYLSESEYDNYFSGCKSIILPYASGYNEHSSGVVLDALFHKKPVLATKVRAFEFVSHYQMGFLYQDDLSVAINEFNSMYDRYRSNIDTYLKQHEVYKNELLEFLDKA